MRDYKQLIGVLQYMLLYIACWSWEKIIYITDCIICKGCGWTCIGCNIQHRLRLHGVSENTMYNSNVQCTIPCCDTLAWCRSWSVCNYFRLNIRLYEQAMMMKKKFSVHAWHRCSSLKRFSIELLHEHIRFFKKAVTTSVLMWDRLTRTFCVYLLSFY